MVKIDEKELKELKMKANIDEELLKSLIKGIEDIKSGRIKEWKKTTH